MECVFLTPPLPSNPTLVTPPPRGPTGASHRLQMTSAPRHQSQTAALHSHICRRVVFGPIMNPAQGSHALRETAT